MTAIKHAEQDARLDTLETVNREFLALATDLVAECKRLSGEVAKLEGVTKAHGKAQVRMKARLKDLEGQA